MADQRLYQTTQNQVGFAPEVAPYATTLLGQAQAFTNPNIPYEAYTGDRFAQFTPMQKQAFAAAQGMQTAPELQSAADMAQTAGQKAMNLSYDPTNYQTGSITSGDALNQYMSPYMQNVVQRQQQDAARQAAISGQAQQAQAARSGAFGGSGNALMRAQAAGNLARQKGDIMATGMQSAYGQAMNQFNTEQQARQQAAQLREQSRQYGAGLGLQGLQTAMTGANTLSNVGQARFGQQKDINTLQSQYGTQQQQQMQNILGAKYQDFLNAQNEPFKRMGFMSDIIRGAPLSQQGSTIYQTPPSTTSQIVGLAGAAATGAKLFGGASGGATKDLKRRPAGLADLAIYKMR
jgi:hypothetical protein